MKTVTRDAVACTSKTLLKGPTKKNEVIKQIVKLLYYHVIRMIIFYIYKKEINYFNLWMASCFVDNQGLIAVTVSPGYDDKLPMVICTQLNIIIPTGIGTQHCDFQYH